MRERLALAGCALALVVGCDTESPVDQPPEVDPTPEKINGKPSKEFEADDIERAEGASQAVRDYCAGAVSEAQRVGCLSHVDEADLP